MEKNLFERWKILQTYVKDERGRLGKDKPHDTGERNSKL